MSKARLFSVIFLGLGAAAVVRSATRFLDELGELSDEIDRGYSSENALPVAGQSDFPDTSGVQEPGFLTTPATTPEPSPRFPEVA